MDKSAPIHKILFSFLKNYICLVIIIIITSLGFAVFESVNVAAIFPVVNSILTESGYVEDYGRIITIINETIQFLPFEDLFFSACFFLIVAAFFKSFFFLLFTYFSNKLSQLSRRDLQAKIYEKFIDSDYQFFLDHKQGALLYRLLNAPVNVGTTLKLIPDIFIQGVKIVFLIILLFSMSPKASLGMLAVGSVFAFLVKKLSDRSYGFGRQITQALSDQTTIANESISGIRQIKIYSSQNTWIKRFKDRIDTYYRFKLRSQIFNAIPVIVLEPVIIIAIGLIGIILKFRYGENFVNLLPVLMVYAFAIIRINPSLSIIGQHRMLIMNVLPDLQICYSTLSAKTRSIHNGHIMFRSLKEKISFENVCFSYPKRGEIFKDLSIVIKKGQVTAIAGPSGAGKSTLMDLLVRLFDPIKGDINIDGIKLKDINISSWRSKIGYVSQEPFIFHATIAENIAFDSAKYSSEEIVEAAKIANAHDFICEFPDGYQTVVGDRGMKLSGGQKQRITIARAIIRKPELIIFDEATSSLDAVSEKLVQQAIDVISKKYTVILIAHRLSTIQGADKILVLDNKRIVEQGNHEELLTLRGIYWRLYNQTISEEAA